MKFANRAAKPRMPCRKSDARGPHRRHRGVAVSPYCRKHYVFLLQNHGAAAVGRTVCEAYQRLEVVEAYAKTVWAAALPGGIKPLFRALIDVLPSPSFP